jgi:hypothetical protein
LLQLRLLPAADLIFSKESRILEKQSWGRREEIDGGGGLLFRLVGEDRSRENIKKWYVGAIKILTVLVSSLVYCPRVKSKLKV